jgi:hypothetical protein
MEDLIANYNIKIYEKVKDLLNLGKNIDDFDFKKDLLQIFKWFTCIKLSEEYNTPFYEYNNIPIDYRKKYCINKYSCIDACNLIDTVVKCSLKDLLKVNDCSTMYVSSLCRNESGNLEWKWNNFIIARNKKSKLFPCINKKIESNTLNDKAYTREEIILYCKQLIQNPPKYPSNIILDINQYEYDTDEEKWYAKELQNW